MVPVNKLCTDTSVDTHRKYLILLDIPTNLLMWVYKIWEIRTSLFNKLDIFLHHIIQNFLGLMMYTVKEQHITNETVSI